MKIEQKLLKNNVWQTKLSEVSGCNCHLVLAFGAPELIVKAEVFKYLAGEYPDAHIVFSSTAGEIINESVEDGTIVSTAIQFEKTELQCIKTNISEHKSSYDAGKFLAEALAGESLQGIYIISDGTLVDGGELTEGLNDHTKSQIPITGGLAGDGARFEKTLTGLNEIPSQGNIIAIGFYGSDLMIGHGSLGGWDEFGYERVITSSNKNVLFELDGKNALQLYKDYLGDYAKDLPGSALLFPLSVKIGGSNKSLIRTILAVDNNNQSMIFAGNVPQGCQSRLMRANFNKLIDASAIAAKDSIDILGSVKPQLTIMVSCVGRKIILDSRTNEEVEAAVNVIGNEVPIAGFYSYGGISPFSAGMQCELHNQTMTITTFSEL